MAADRLSTIRQTLETHGQTHVLRFYDELSEAQQSALLDQIERIDFRWLDEQIERYVRSDAAPAPALAPAPDSDLEPVSYYPSVAVESAADEAVLAVRARGEDVVRRGALAAFTVAGGQGTRLGWRGPKGTYPATPITGKPLFRCFAEQLIAAQRKYGVEIPWYIMTSPVNDAATRAFLVDNNCFGLLRTNIMMFPQGTLPSLAAETGRLLLAEKHEIATSPDGHGGAFRALRTSGAIEHMAARGIEHISSFQVDNPLVNVVDPYFLGLHATAPDSSGEMSSKVVEKIAPDEKVGVFVRRAGETMVVEYSDLPKTLATAREPDGRLRFRAASIAVHLLGLDFVTRLTADDGALPLHRAKKKIPYIDPQTGERVTPPEANGIKLESFLFDAIPRARASIVCETDRADEFAPIKNDHGADSPATSHRLQIDRGARWLAAHGVDVARDDAGHATGRIEIGPLTATEPADLVSVDLPERVGAGEELVL